MGSVSSAWASEFQDSHVLKNKQTKQSLFSVATVMLTHETREQGETFL